MAFPTSPTVGQEHSENGRAWTCASILPSGRPIWNLVPVADGLVDQVGVSAGNAAAAALQASADSDQVQAAKEEFDRRFLGSHAANPVIDANGNPVEEGAIYYNTGSKSLLYYIGTGWTAAGSGGGGGAGDVTLDGVQTLTNKTLVAPEITNPTGLTKADVGLGQVNNTADADKPVSSATSAALGNKVDKVSGKVLSSNDYTSADKTKLDGIATNATANATDAQLRDRSTHTGAQAISTITGLQTALDGKAGTADATTSASGLMSGSDKTKLNGVAAGATAYTDASARAAVESVLPTTITRVGRVITDPDTITENGDYLFDTATANPAQMIRTGVLNVYSIRHCGNDNSATGAAMQFATSLGTMMGTDANVSYSRIRVSGGFWSQWIALVSENALTMALIPYMRTSEPLLTSAREGAAIATVAMNGATNIDLSIGTLWAWTAYPTANFPLNFRWSSGVTLASKLSTGVSVTIAVLVPQGATPYIPSSISIDGVAVTPKWLGGTGPVGNANSVDLFTFTIIQTGSGTTRQILASQARYA